MQITRSPGTKLLLSSLVGAVLAIPLFMIFLLVYDRENQSEVARASIAQGWGGPQRLAGPLLVLPYTREDTSQVKENGSEVTRVTRVPAELYLVPEALRIDTAVQPERRKRSIYETVVYGADIKGHARYRLPPGELARLGVSPEQIAFDRAELRFGISDPGALKQVSRVAVDGIVLAPQPGNGPAATKGAGFFVALDAGALRENALSADFQLGLRGHSELTLIPRAGNTEWNVRSSWPHPSFTGRFLPESHRVGADGFAATWKVTNLALGETLLSTQQAAAGSSADDSAPEARVELLQPVDIYAQVNRAVKYGFLFIGFTFMAFLMFDVVGGRPVAAVEYLLVGAGLVLFFVMLLAMAEVIGFALAYAAAAGAIDLLLTAYSAAVLGSWKRAFAVSALLAGLYAVLYVLLSLEEYSLLIGSLLLFVALAGVMFLTRGIQWGGEPAEEVQPAAV